MQQEPRILRHPLASRIFHWSLILGFLPAALSGFVIWWKPEGEDFVNLAMRIHIIGATIFTVASILFTILATDRVVAFIRHISEWTMHDVRWLMVGGGYMHKIVFKKEIPVPPMDKMNSGQKSMGALMLHGGIFLMVSGWLLYAFLPITPREIAYWLGLGHEWIGLLLGVSTLAHIGLGIYNQAEFKSMFGDGTIPLAVAEKHSPLWVERHVEPIISDATPSEQVLQVQSLG